MLDKWLQNIKKRHTYLDGEQGIPGQLINMNFKHLMTSCSTRETNICLMKCIVIHICVQHLLLFVKKVVPKIYVLI